MATFYAAPNGTAGSAGTLAAPWSKEWMFSASNTTLQPGDTVRLLPGVYAWPSATTGNEFVATKAGTVNAPIVYRPHIDSERTCLSGRVRLDGDNCTFFGLEFTYDSNETRDGGANEESLLRYHTGFDPFAANLRFIECSIHDMLSGMFAGNEAPGLQVLDCYIYNNGVDGPTRGHGHALYIQGEQFAAGKLFQNIISWGGYKHGMQYYGTSSSKVWNLTTRNSSFFMMGAWSAYGEDNPLVSWQVAPGDGGNLLWDNVNLFRAVPAPGGRGARIGVSTGWNASNVVMRNCTMRGAAELLRPNDLTFTDNLVWVEDSEPVINTGQPVMIELQSSQPASAFTIDRNQYFKRSSSSTISVNSLRANGWELNGSITTANPTGVRCTATPCAYTRGKGHLHIWNFSGASSVTVDIGAAVHGLTGFPYAIYHAFDWVTGGAPLVTGTYDGTRVTIPMDARSHPRPYGAVQPVAPVLPNTFGAFVVTQRPGWTVNYRRGI